MTIEIPTWLLWTLGIAVGVPVVAIIVIAAVIGFMFISCWEPPSW